jgi:hypothetical protein
MSFLSVEKVKVLKVRYIAKVGRPNRFSRNDGKEVKDLESKNERTLVEGRCLLGCFFIQREDMSLIYNRSATYHGMKW